jgi:hypothetical protein
MHNEFPVARESTLVASLLYLMTHYSRTGCPLLAGCIARHMESLATHPDADRVVRDICQGLQSSWHAAACVAPASPPSIAPRSSVRH